MSPKHIVLLVHTLGQGGTDRVCVLLANGFAAQGWRTTVIVVAEAGSASGLLLTFLDSRVERLFLRPTTGWRTLDLILALPLLSRHLVALSLDVVLATGNNMNLVAAIACPRGVALAMKTTNPIVRRSDGWLKRGFRKFHYRQVFRRATSILTLSHAETAELITAFPSVAHKFTTVANPYVTAAMLGGGTVQDAHQGKKLILGIGRLEPQKNFALLLRAFALLDDPHTRLVILGEGSLRRDLQALAAQLGVADRTQFPGFASDVAPWLRRADVFALSSLYEGLPAVVLEAMACGCQVVATDCFPIARELLGGNDGSRVIDSFRPEAFAAALADLLAHGGRATDLVGVSLDYTLEAATLSHIHAIRTGM